MKEFTTYLNFETNSRDAMTFYGKCLGIEPSFMTFAEANCGMPPEAGHLICHARIAKGNVAVLMASDTPPGMEFIRGNNFSVSINCESKEEIERLFNAFSEGGTVKMALQDMFWGAHFGLLEDKFGVNWMFNYELPK